MARFWTRGMTGLLLVFAIFSGAFAEVKPSPPTMVPTPILPSMQTFGSPNPPGFINKEMKDFAPSMMFWLEEFAEGGFLKTDTQESKMTWPVQGPITSPFGPRASSMHEGIDISVPFGTEIQAALEGIVVQARVYNGYGKTVVLEHGNDLQTLYAHCSELLVRQGEYVQQGQVIAHAGNTGRATTAHLHFGVLVKSVFYDPVEFIGERSRKFARRPSQSSVDAQ